MKPLKWGRIALGTRFKYIENFLYDKGSASNQRGKDGFIITYKLFGGAPGGSVG